jgi:hypothetical protein
MSDTVNIKGLDKTELLVRLWCESKVLSVFGFGPMIPYQKLYKDAEAALAKKKRIDYFNGVPIKTDLDEDEVDPWLYDRDNEEGAFARVVQTMRDEQ